ncbi:MAG: hypothetical protein P8182_16990, partial [Deltaproteobacteria bacterium]
QDSPRSRPCTHWSATAGTRHRGMRPMIETCTMKGPPCEAQAQDEQATESVYVAANSLNLDRASLP